MNAKPVRGSCLCGDVAYEVHGPLRNVVACHCLQCRKQTGHYMAATSARREDVRFVRDASLRWFRSSAEAERGFCSRCGSVMFWRREGRPDLSITAGTIDGPTGVVTEGHIFCASKGDYYEIPDEGYRREGWT